MSEAPWFDAQPAPPWSARLYARLPVSAPWTGALIAGAYLAGSALYLSLVQDRTQVQDMVAFWAHPGGWTVLVNAVLIGLAPTWMVMVMRTAVQDTHALAPVLPGSAAEREALARGVARVAPGALRAWGAVGLAGTVAFAFFDPGLWSTRARPPLTDPFFVWFAFQQGLLGWLWARAIVADVSTARSFAGLAARVEPVDLLDLRPLQVFARRGVRSVLYWMVSLAIFSLFWLAPNSGRSNVSILFLFGGVSAASLALPLMAVHRRIRAEKDALLARIRESLRENQRTLLAPGAGGNVQTAAARLPALYAAEARVAGVREWPFDAGTSARFALVVLLGVGSWVGGALVERLLGAALE